MNTYRPHLAKILRPKLPRVLPRERLFALLDADAGKPLIWVAGPGGCGKTTLVASWLDARALPCLWYGVDKRDRDPATFFHYMAMAAHQAAPRKRRRLPSFAPVYLQGLSAFAKRFFEALFATLGTPSVLVLDNYQDAQGSPLFRQVIHDALSVMPPGIRCVVVSRSGPEPSFARLSAHSQMQTLGWEDLRLTLEEARTMAHLIRGADLSDAVLRQHYAKVDGWVAGLILALEAGRDVGTKPLAGTAVPGAAFFDYFAAEVFDREKPHIQAFLLKTAFLPDITPRTAQQLTGLDRCGQILGILHHNSLFTEEHTISAPVYRYHPLFREFLLSRAGDLLAPEELSALRSRAGQLLEAAGREDDAVELFMGAADWKNAVRLILSRAFTMVEQARYRHLEQWLAGLPARIVEDSPWLLFSKASCRIPSSLSEGRSLFEQSFHRFSVSEDIAGGLAAWCGVIDSIFMEYGECRRMDPWVAWLDAHLSDDPVFPSPQIELMVIKSMLGVLFARMPDHPRAHLWLERAEAMLDGHLRIDDTVILAARLYQYYIHIGDYSRARLLYRRMLPIVAGNPLQPFTRLWWNALRLSYGCLSVEPPDTFFPAMEQALAQSRKIGIRILDANFLWVGAQAALTHRDLPRLERILAEMERMSAGTPNSLLALYNLFAACKYAHQGSFREALDHGRISLHLLEGFGRTILAFWAGVLVAYALFGLGEHEEAWAHLQEARRKTERISGFCYEGFILFIEAYMVLKRGNRPEGGPLLGKALAAFRHHDNIQVAYWVPAMTSWLCARALEDGIETDYVAEIIRKVRLTPDPADASLARWPFSLRIHTLGRFEILRDDVPIDLGKKVPRMPLALLKAIIASGTGEVGEAQVADVLWPEADGDAAHSAFSTTLQRLRRLLDVEGVLRIRGGNIGLDPRFCWVDAHAFDHLANAMGANPTHRMPSGHVAPPSEDETERLLAEALNLYRGPFLPGESGAPWILAARERLRARHLHLILTAGKTLEASRRWEEAAGFYLRGLETDPLAEEVYQHLMACYERLGRRAEGAAIYDRCRNMLSSLLRVEPSPRTTEIYRSLIR